MGLKPAEAKQEMLFYAGESIEIPPGHPFYQRLERMLKTEGFDQFCEEQCARFYHADVGRPSLAPGVYFRLLLIGFFEGIDQARKWATSALSRS